jgi:hypothetical protein
MLALAIISAHLVGDFLLQNHWMQQKSKSSFVCSVHVACYSLPWLVALALTPLAWWQFALIIAEHWLQDRFGLHLKWMKLYKQTTPDLWPVGPLCMDQSMHIAWIAIVMSL